MSRYDFKDGLPRVNSVSFRSSLIVTVSVPLDYVQLVGNRLLEPWSSQSPKKPETLQMKYE